MTVYGQRENESRRDRQRRLDQQQKLRAARERADVLEAEGEYEEAARVRAAAMGREYKPPEPTVVDRAVEAIRAGKFGDAVALTGDIAEVATQLGQLGPGTPADKVDGEHPGKVLHEIRQRLGDREGEHMLDQYVRYLERGGEE